MSILYKILITLFLFLSVFLLIDSNRIADYDLFCHLYSGKEIADQREVHKSDSHSFSVYGGSWIDYEWMARLLFFLLYKQFGSAGLVFLRIILSILVFLILLRHAGKLSGSLSIAIFSVLLGAAASYRYFLFRPQLFTFFLLSLLMFLLYHYEEHGKKKILLFFPFLFLVWGNLHGGFPLGLVILGMFILHLLMGKLLANQRIFVKPSHSFGSVLLLLITFFISLFVTLINPYGIDMWKGILRTVFGTFTPELSEWKPAFEFPFFSLFWFYIFSFLYGVTFIISKKKKLFDLLLFILMIYLALTKVRFIPILAILLIPSLAFYLRNAGEWLASKREKMLVIRSLRFLLSFYLLFFIVSVPIFIKVFQGDIHLNAYIYRIEPFQPLAPVKLLRDNFFKGNIMNEYDWGGYIHWELPESKIFVDGRSDTVYPHEIIKKWSVFVEGEVGWQNVLGTSGADAILIRSHHSVNDKIEELKNWKLVYFDNIAALYMNLESASNAEFLKRWKENSLVLKKNVFKDHTL